MTSSHDPDDSAVAETVAADAMPGTVVDDSASVMVVASLAVKRTAVMIAVAAAAAVVAVISSPDSNPDLLDFRNSSGSEYAVSNVVALVYSY